MALLNGNQRDMSGSSDKTSFTCRTGNLNIRYQKDTNGRMIPVARPPFIKIK